MADNPTERELRDRLARLLAAVPTEAAAIEATSRPTPTARPTVIGRTRLGLGGVTLALIAIVVGALAFSQRPTSGGPVTGVATDGPFKLTITVPHSHYGAGEAITGVTALFEYTGSAPSVSISHAATLMGFAVASTDGRHDAEPAWAQSCVQTVVSASSPATAAFVKSGGYFPEESDFPWLQAYFAERSLVLDPGEWTITAMADFTEGTCGGGPQHDLRASVTIAVGGYLLGQTPTPLSSPPNEPSPTAPEVDGLPLLTVSQAIAERDGGLLGGTSFALTGYWSASNLQLFCAAPPPGTGALEMWCMEQSSRISELPTLNLDRPHLTPWIPEGLPGAQALFELPVIHGQPYPPVPIVVIGHFNDPQADQCRPEARQVCLDRMVLERIVSFEPDAVATPGISPTPTPFPSPAPSAPFDASRCAGDVPYSFVGWTTGADLHGGFGSEYPHVFAMITQDVIKLTAGTWERDPNGSGHGYQIWGQKICFSPEEPGLIEFTEVAGTAYVLWDDGRRTPGISPIYADSH